jgi:hypothetical protein
MSSNLLCLTEEAIQGEPIEMLMIANIQEMGNLCGYIELLKLLTNVVMDGSK